ncbi:hypothetical protein [uncultured Algoriphagus sp.]|uniref:hypothetical protein n=1 Tax=uncultured Algoriphagus sp. TaxID=417365 RepID=UPI0030EB52EA|tara:strand:+ start:328 stop:495 length:168 start_codon:yes stop_codon:yes gene_type:complete
MDNQAKSRQQIADEYGVSTKTLLRWIKKERIVISNGLVTPKEQSVLYEKFGNPKR